jgi:mannose-1-phosphate guanylyltransferase
MSAARGIPRQAVILVGGEGTRLRPVTSRVPKPVAPVVERPFVAYILDNLARHGVERAVFSTGYLAEAIEAVIGDGTGYGLEVEYAVEAEPLGTAGAIANCEDKLDDGSFYVFNGDVLSDVDLGELGEIHVAKGGMGTIFLTPVEDPRRYGLVELREDGSVASFLEKPGDWEGTALINAGVYVLEPEVLEMVPRGRLFSIERGVFPKLASAGSLYGYVDSGYWRDIGTPDSYLQAHFDILERTVDTTVADTLGDQFVYVSPSGAPTPWSARARRSRRRSSSPVS